MDIRAIIPTSKLLREQGAVGNGCPRSFVLASYLKNVLAADASQAAGPFQGGGGNAASVAEEGDATALSQLSIQLVAPLNLGTKEEQDIPSYLFTVTSDEERERLRLDVFLSRHCGDLSRSHLKRLIQGGRVTVNERPGRPSYEVRTTDSVQISWADPCHEEGALTPQPMPLEILYEDEDLLVLNKAPGVVVHPGAGNEEGTLVHGLLAHCPRLALQGAPKRPGIVHRLDQNTSGAMVVAKSEKAYLDLIRQFKSRDVHKIYLALVYGEMPQRRGEILSDIARHPVDRKRMAVVDDGRGREAVSHWEVEEAWGEVTLVRVTIQTGRTHQIRVHMSHIRHPVVGDETYGGGARRARAVRSKGLQDILLQAHRQMLHAWHLTFLHPRTEKRLDFTAPLPADFERVLAAVRKGAAEGKF